MKHVQRAMCSVAIAITFIAGVSAQAKPDFAGTWKAAGSFDVWTITVDGSTMTVTRTVAGNSEATVYRLDGTPSAVRQEGPNGPFEIVYTSTWEDNVLVTTITAPTMTRIERRSMEADGTMKVQTTLTIIQGKPAPPPPPGALAPMVFKRVKMPVTADWPQWRGVSRDGSIAATLPSQWPDALTKRWEIPVGSGHASPVVSGSRVAVLSRQGEDEIVRALDLTSGTEVWRSAYPAPSVVNAAASSHGAGPKSTPAIADGRVFTLGISGILSAFDLTNGDLIWRVPAPEVQPQYGATTSPLIDGANLIVHVGGYDSGALTSFDAATGAVRWQWTGDGPGNGSPIIATIGGVRQVIAQTQKFLVGLDASTGAMLWQFPFTTDFDQNAFTPLVFQDLLLNAGLDHPFVAIRLKRDGDRWAAETAWINPQAEMFMSSPVLIDGTIYGLTRRNKGQFVAVDAATGKTLWTTQGREGEHASMMGNPSWLLASTTEGNLVVARTNAHKYEEVRRYQVAESAMWAHPVITATSIIVKDVDKVICWDF